MCTDNENGRVPSCLEAKYGGPGCEDLKLCEECRKDAEAVLRGCLKGSKGQAPFTVKVPCLTFSSRPPSFRREISLDFEREGDDVHLWFPLHAGKFRVTMRTKDLLGCFLALFPEVAVPKLPKKEG